MTAPRTPRKPTFFWQGMLILLPVAVLAVVSLASLRRDEQAAEQAARQRAAGNVQSLARAIRSTVNDELHQFLTLQNVWTMELRLTSQPSVTTTPDDKLTADITRWERDYPGLKLSELAVPECDLLANGRQIKPRDIPIAPVPPKWFRELSPRQRELWESLRPIAATNAAPRPAVRAFMDSDISQEAAQVAWNLAALPPEKRILNGELSESGISFRGIAFYRLFQNPATTLSNAWAQQFWEELFESPSFIAPALLDMAESRTNGTDAVLCEKVHCMRQLWNIQSKAREWLASVHQLPELGNWSLQRPWMHWTAGITGDALAIFQPCTFVEMGNDSEGVPFSGRGYRVWFVPRRVIENIFAKALTENRYLIPEFARAALSVQGMPLNGLPDAGPAHKESLLGSATQEFGKYSYLDSATFDLEFHLTSREQMLSVEHRRAELFFLLILGTLVTAVVGLIGARHAFHRQRQLNEMKSNFVSSMSHELRAPIASVRLMAENLEGNKIPEPQKQKEYFGFIVQECRRLTALIENVLDFSRIEQGRKQYEFEPTDLVALVKQTMILMQPNAAEKGVRLVLETSNIEHRTSNIELEIDGRAIQQALVNLIDNAIKHSPKGGTVTVGINAPSVTCQVSGEQSPDVSHSPSSILHPRIALWVADHGPGIPPAEHGKIFERFYRRGSELRRETQGVGIGLSIVKHIIAAHGGRVLVQSEPGQGSRFTIELPIQP